MGRKTHAEHVADIKKVNPNIEILEEIKSAKQKVLCRCLVCYHEWRPTPDKLKRGRRCPKCSGQIKRTQEEHQADVTAANPNIKILGKVERVDKPVLCLCLACGHKWNARISNIKNGRGCPECARRIRGMKKRLTTKEFIEKAEKIHGGFYDYSQVNYTTAKKDVIIICPIHGEFKQWPSNHLNGQGCPLCCGTAKKSSEEFIKEARPINGDEYDYSLVEYVNNNTKVKIICKVHGVFEQTPINHLKGEGCPLCAKRGFRGHEAGKLYIMVDDLNVPTIMKIGVSVNEKDRSKAVLNSARRAGVTIPALHVAKTWEGPTDLMQRIESMMHDNYKEWNIKFPAKFDGCTEFFQYNPETAEVFDIIEETIHEIVNANKAA
ncbi:hypothetical protein QWR64_003982 [Escherichia coli]|nr:hypothetical protein [Escherichia coli]